MSWFTDRLSERTSQGAMAVFVTSASIVASTPESWTAAAPWMHLIPLFTACLVNVFIPEGANFARSMLPPEERIAPVDTPQELKQP